MAKIEIQETKQLGYDFVKSQNSGRMGVDIAFYEASQASGFDASTYTPVYSSINAMEIENQYEEESDDKYPLDEEGAIKVVKAEKFGYEIAEFDYNKKNPAHVYLNKASKIPEMRKNIPYAKIDYTDNMQEYGTANLDVKVKEQGGETRTISVTINTIGKPTIEEIDSTDTHVSEE